MADAAKRLHLCFHYLGRDHHGQTYARTRICGINNCKDNHKRLLHAQRNQQDRIGLIEDRIVICECLIGRSQEISMYRVLKHQPETASNPVALPVLYFYWSLYPIAAIALSGGFIVSILLPIVSFSNHKPRLEPTRVPIPKENRWSFHSFKIPVTIRQRDPTLRQWENMHMYNF